MHGPAQREGRDCHRRGGITVNCIAPVAVSLACGESRFVTGQTMFADGGYCLV